MARWNLRSRGRINRVRESLTQRLDPVIPRACTHHRGHGGVKGAIRRLHGALGQANFVARFDIASYYKSIQHDLLMAQLEQAGASESELALAEDYLRLPDRQGSGRGIVASAGLSPLFGGLYLSGLDRAMVACQRAGQLICYVRFMDDVVLLAKSRWQLRRAIAQLHAVLRPLNLRLHRRKRFIGRVIVGFDFLGYCLRAANG